MKQYLIAVLLAHSTNLGLTKDGRRLRHLLRRAVLDRRVVRAGEVARANLAIIGYHQTLRPLTPIFGTGTLSSSMGSGSPPGVAGPASLIQVVGTTAWVSVTCRSGAAAAEPARSARSAPR
ncbi:MULTISPECIES: Tn3 family transposase [unclassified Rhodococcus (in: high G+C Gram-positive bacteria)]|uniref:Tn3 family transposase n=1 Tax=unclassified Rhodococcus (in: high G+C Gram-positive bacteria) TaxID=192944 RepID=UPI001639625C|nr:MULTISPECIES: Tn3 family transposase [unclassified Rhodococcus (in: high G+C Gram-positive bacteria)]MBC2644214.1 Tn3 family transposase [Rhodococcus sp. 3A]MBC2891047.1 Tn3 family transposase [Rhodococcus sp. 4CII]